MLSAEQEKAIKQAMKNLDALSLQNLKDHANIVNAEDHSSAHIIKKWILGSAAVLVGPGMIWYIIKLIKNH
ncbi:MAG: hypothetical protein IPN10_18005 [Saprospiraceae bacterium]|nr:hypothetical protein [Saprospiraceae bacterium]